MLTDDGIRVLEVYEEAAKIKHLALLDCTVTLTYDAGVPAGCPEAVENLFGQKSLIVNKKSKNGPVDQDIIPMIKKLSVEQTDDHHLTLRALVCCQNPSLNPMQLAAAVEKYLPEYAPNHTVSCRLGLYDPQEKPFR